MQILLLTLSSILIVIGPITYIVSITRGVSRPHRMTRFILAFVLGINFFSILAAHGNTGAQVFSGFVFLQALIIFLLSLWQGMGGTNISDYVCLVIAVIGIIGWQFTGDPIIGIWFSILADFSAYVPAFIKTWKHPNTESPWYYFLSMIAVILSLLAYNLDTSSIFQIYIGLCSIAMIAIIYHKKLLKIIRL